ncbi:hypothetical protein [Neisseria dumasiana]|uniref:hypothetical protein n=1 Tax=Neisseria dumasiana TaxID=1931275 RepID=UPI000A19976A|nr:hypothetical protein [Neisseria dumasiana]OSI16308.1 hypothetical protein BV914_04455 [Neisseria dumasiana]
MELILSVLALIASIVIPIVIYRQWKNQFLYQQSQIALATYKATAARFFGDLQKVYKENGIEWDRENLGADNNKIIEYISNSYWNLVSSYQPVKIFLSQFNKDQLKEIDQLYLNVMKKFNEAINGGSIQDLRDSVNNIYKVDEDELYFTLLHNTKIYKFNRITISIELKK